MCSAHPNPSGGQDIEGLPSQANSEVLLASVHYLLPPFLKDNEGQIPLLWAVKHGHDRIVKPLLGQEGVNPNMPDNDG